MGAEAKKIFGRRKENPRPKAVCTTLYAPNCTDCAFCTDRCVMTVIEADGGFVVVQDNSPNGRRTLAGPYPTSAQAWRAADRLEGEPISPAEKRADWISNKILSAGPAPRGRNSAEAGGNPQKASRNAKRQAKKMKRAAAKAPAWLRKGASAKFDPQGNRAHREWQLGTFGAASEVRRMDPADYLASQQKGAT
ncbi:hypothetical protein NKI89_24880 [Mesorhizobium sp. M0309]|uniref:hypothetical protein n=1 Tax=Mesorhizobium sp. M0309 TaxID=2956933 RepID=UPI00333689EB